MIPEKCAFYKSIDDLINAINEDEDLSIKSPGYQAVYFRIPIPIMGLNRTILQRVESPIMIERLLYWKVAQFYPCENYRRVSYCHVLGNKFENYVEEFFGPHVR